MSIKKLLLTLAVIACLPLNAYAKKDDVYIPKNFPQKYDKEYVLGIMPVYKSVSKEPVVMVALDMLVGTNGEFSRNAILGNNLSQRPMKVEFKNLSEIKADYTDFDALGWKKGKELTIYVNSKHRTAPPGALAALLSHEALHQDEYNSIAEETYAWTMEAAVWCEILRKYPESEDDKLNPLVKRENNLKRMFEKGNYSDKYIKKEVRGNASYRGLPQTSPGFEDL
ncbi:hypothetical protein IKP85_06130 [bacterium]|nr:hypothetical protein [bacterium]